MRDADTQDGESHGCVVEVPLEEHSECISRNGTFKAESMTATRSGDMVNIRFVSRTLHRELHGGATIGVADMDKLARQWLQARRGKKEVSGKNEVAKLIRKLAKLVESGQVRL